VIGGGPGGGGGGVGGGAAGGCAGAVAGWGGGAVALGAGGEVGVRVGVGVAVGVAVGVGDGEAVGAVVAGSLEADAGVGETAEALAVCCRSSDQAPITNTGTTTRATAANVNSRVGGNRARPGFPSIHRAICQTPHPRCAARPGGTRAVLARCVHAASTRGR
jgi:hypothetical protein